MRVLLALAAVAFSLSWLLPGHYWPWRAFQQELAAAIGSLLFGLAVLLRAKGIAWPSVTKAALACAAIPLLQWQFGIVHFASDAVLAATYVAGFGLCVATGATAMQERRLDVTTTILGALTFAAAFSVAIALAQWLDIGSGLFVDAMPSGGRTWANLGQPNNFASALAIAICATLLAFSRRTISGPFTVVMLAWLGFGLLTTQSRTGYAFVLLLAAGLLVFGRRARIPVKPVAVIVSAALFFAAATVWPVLNAALDMAEPASLAQRVTGGAYRLIHWQVLVDAILQRPWFGYGWTQVALAQHAAIANYPATGEVLGNSHNIVLDLLVWNGLPIGIAITVFAAWWFFRQFKDCNSPERFFPLAIVCALTLHGLLELPLEYAYFLLPLGFMVGALEGQQAGDVSSSKTSRLTFAAIWTTLAVMTCWITVEYMQVESTSRVLRFVAMGIGTDRVNHAPEPDVLLLDRPKQLHRFMLTPARKDPDPAYMEWVRFMTMRHSTPPAMLRHALAAGLNGRRDEAELVLIRMCKLFKAGSCDQGRISWAGLQAKYPELVGIPYPAVSEP